MKKKNEKEYKTNLTKTKVQVNLVEKSKKKRESDEVIKILTIRAITNTIQRTAGPQRSSYLPGSLRLIILFIL